MGFLKNLNLSQGDSPLGKPEVINRRNMNTIHDIAIFVAIFASGMLAGYILKLIIERKNGYEEK